MARFFSIGSFAARFGLTAELAAILQVKKHLVSAHNCPPNNALLDVVIVHVST